MEERTLVEDESTEHRLEKSKVNKAKQLGNEYSQLGIYKIRTQQRFGREIREIKRELERRSARVKWSFLIIYDVWPLGNHNGKGPATPS